MCRLWGQPVCGIHRATGRKLTCKDLNGNTNLWIQMLQEKTLASFFHKVLVSKYFSLPASPSLWLLLHSAITLQKQ